MSDFFENIKSQTDDSFFIGVFQDNIDKSNWHYHQEYELSFIIEGSGKRIVGDSIQEFYPGDLIFIGPRLPHVWLSEKPKFKTVSPRTLESVYMLFNESVIPDAILSLPEFSGVKKAIQYSDQGLKIVGNTLNDASRIMLQLPYMAKFERMISFFEIMNLIGNSNSIIPLASNDYMTARIKPKNDRIKIIHEYLMENYQEEINLESVASMVHMAPGSICRYFKASTGMTIFEYLNKIKVEYACKLLMNQQLSITNISLDCGFSNLSHFNKQFKKHCNKTPNEFRKQFIVG